METIQSSSPRYLDGCTRHTAVALGSITTQKQDKYTCSSTSYTHTVSPRREGHAVHLRRYPPCTFFSAKPASGKYLPQVPRQPWQGRQIARQKRTKKIQAESHITSWLRYKVVPPPGVWGEERKRINYQGNLCLSRQKIIRRGKDKKESVANRLLGMRRDCLFRINKLLLVLV